ncbi:sulfate adenylyltransferase subunit CysN [Rhizobiales bacterium RZME27]|jgi:bifunctional enzyme CysN/CysC|uniref:Multifunctional fusion protein n=1 Tax=Endobacterium cereale TaxID=2663029 RepID=A0A6A8AH71_9HYPH|nr:sulfate adenylyltransferase subunit CysN [Endobacterium cereale]MQY48141.1 sulfate adenylyltransferase subunit CysN [Endobacterium cereale]
MGELETTHDSKISEFLIEQEDKSILRFLTCGSVDDGKSTLIGRLLYDTQLLYEDQLATLTRDSKIYGTAGDDIDFALLVDGLEAEREQGITIDVAYRFFSTQKRKFIVADAPGHEEYTRNMATGASTADLAIVLLDVRHGLRTQTKRHSYIASLLGIKNIILAVNKLDLVGFEESQFRRITEDFSQYTREFGFSSVQAIPISARYGDNVVTLSDQTTWYEGPSLLQALEAAHIVEAPVAAAFRFPVQYVCRSNADFRGLAGQVAGGKIRRGETVLVAKSGETSRIKDIVTKDGSLSEAFCGQAITIVLADELDVSRGDMLSSPEEPPCVADQFQAKIIWFDSAPLIPNRSYTMKTENDTVTASITHLKYGIDINTYTRRPARSLARNEVGICNLATQSMLAFDPYKENRSTGNFILIDRHSNATVGAGMIDFALRRSSNVKWQLLEVTKVARARLMGQQPVVMWFTGLSGSGKSTIANSLEKLLHAHGRHTIVLDGDNIRHGLCRDLGFTDGDRVENIRRVTEVSKLMSEAGLITIVSFISPFRSERQFARESFDAGEFIEIYIDTPIEECIRRDPKGLYKRALADEIPNFTGVSSVYEEPLDAEIRLSTKDQNPDVLSRQVFDYLQSKGYLK